MDDEYVAGLWRKSLPTALLWGSDWPCSPNPCAYRAPSWSWAAYDGRVLMHVAYHYADLDNERVACVTNLLIVPATENKFGRPSHTSLEVKGPVRPLIVTQDGKWRVFGQVECDCITQVALDVACDDSVVHCLSFSSKSQSKPALDWNPPAKMKLACRLRAYSCVQSTTGVTRNWSALGRYTSATSSCTRCRSTGCHESSLRAGHGWRESLYQH